MKIELDLSTVYDALFGTDAACFRTYVVATYVFWFGTLLGVGRTLLRKCQPEVKFLLVLGGVAAPTILPVTVAILAMWGFYCLAFGSEK